MATATVTRRSVMGAIALAPMAGVAIAPAAGATDFDRVLAAYRKAREECLRYESDVLNPAIRRYDALATAIPHTTVEWTGWMGTETWSTADPKRVRDAHYYLRPSPLPFDPAGAPYKEACETLVAADGRRKRRLDAAKRVSGAEAAEAAHTDLEKAEDAASKIVALHPVDTAADLVRKVAVVAASAWWDVDEVRDSLAADAKRLGGVA